jgi:hypothetical protein
VGEDARGTGGGAGICGLVDQDGAGAGSVGGEDEIGRG